MAKTWARRLGYTLGGLIALIVVLVAGIYGFTSHRFSRTHDAALIPVAALRDSASVARGHHLATALGKCVDCHGQDLGGQVFINDPGLGILAASNLTGGTGGVLSRYTDAQLARAIRHGVAAGGRALKVMPSDDFHAMADEDVAALIGYIRSLPPVNRELPPANLKLLARALYTAGQLPILAADRIDHSAPSRARVPRETPLAYGRYLADVGGCTGCHGPGLSGGKIPGAPPEWKPAANLTPAAELARWTGADFTRALREGVRPNGSKIDPAMPWRLTKDMTDEEIQAVWTYLRSVPPRATGNR